MTASLRTNLKVVLNNSIQTIYNFYSRERAEMASANLQQSGVREACEGSDGEGAGEYTAKSRGRAAGTPRKITSRLVLRGVVHTSRQKEVMPEGEFDVKELRKNVRTQGAALCRGLGGSCSSSALRRAFVQGGARRRCAKSVVVLCSVFSPYGTDGVPQASAHSRQHRALSAGIFGRQHHDCKYYASLRASDCILLASSFFADEGAR